MKKILLTVFITLNSVLNITFAQSRVPEWAEGVVWYQIFPERFASADTSNDPEPQKVFLNEPQIPEGWTVTPWISNWFAQADWEKKLGGNFRDHLYERRYGGDIEGIINHLDYLKELGVGAIYLNPVFESISLHKYDASSYHHIDVNFGPDPEGDRKLMQSESPNDPKTWKWTEADKLFLKLIKEVHKKGMRIIIDGVFNHTGVQFWAFQDIIRHGEKSKYKDWYIIRSFDNPATPENEFDYEGWWDVPSMPEFNRTDKDLFPGPKQYIFHSTKRWMDPDGNGDPSDGIDGWRLDVAREVPLGFWRDWNMLVKSVNPDAIIIGELWEISPDFISKHGVFDALMNYNFAFAVNNFFIAQEKRIPVSEFIERLKEIDRSYPSASLNILQNLLDSHDTDRLPSMIKNPDRQYDRDGDERNPNYNPGKPTKDEYDMQKLIAAFQMTYRGAPMIYYGDEAGMWGADDPHDRKPMVWDNLNYDDEVITPASGFGTGYGDYKVAQNKDVLEFYRKIISIRKNSSALRYGDLNFLYSNDQKQSFAFRRMNGGEIVIAAFNIGKETDKFDLTFDDKKLFYEELLSGEKGVISGSDQSLPKLTVNLSPKSVKIFKIISTDYK